MSGLFFFAMLENLRAYIPPFSFPRPVMRYVHAFRSACSPVFFNSYRTGVDTILPFNLFNSKCLGRCGIFLYLAPMGQLRWGCCDVISILFPSAISLHVTSRRNSGEDSLRAHRAPPRGCPPTNYSHPSPQHNITMALHL